MVRKYMNFSPSTLDFKSEPIPPSQRWLYKWQIYIYIDLQPVYISNWHFYYMEPPNEHQIELIIHNAIYLYATP
jgi:hypothetical protein